jgi:putative DNA primase/helicase
MRGDALIIIDNCNRPIGGQDLCQSMTQSLVSCRILGKSEMPNVPNTATIGGTGNNLVVLDDMVRRSIVGRLDPKCARPETRQYDFDPIAYAHENRAQLVVDILTLLKAYHNAGRLNCRTPLQSFVHWSNTVRGCICWFANLAAPCKTMERVRETDPVMGNLKLVLEAWRDHFGDAPVTTSAVIDTAEATRAELISVAPYTPEERKTIERRVINGNLHDALIRRSGKKRENRRKINGYLAW